MGCMKDSECSVHAYEIMSLRSKAPLARIWHLEAHSPEVKLVRWMRDVPDVD